MFFNLRTGEIAREMSGFICWVADGNIWFADGSLENSINQPNFETLCQFLEKSSESRDYADLQDGDFLYALEKSEEGYRNVSFGGNNTWIAFKMRSGLVASWSRFLLAESKR
jgi:hypothetical protein